MSELLLQSVVLCSLEVAKKIGDIRSVSIPAIGSGIFGFPKPKCAEIMIQNSIYWLALNSEDDSSKVNTIRLCNFDRETVTIFKRFLIQRYSPPKPLLFYFDAYGRAEPIRMAYHVAGVRFNDTRIASDKW